MPNAIKMYAQLMQPSRQRIRPNQSVRVEPLDDLKLGGGWFSAGGIDGNPSGGELPQRLINYAATLGDNVVHQSQVGFLDGSAGKLLAEKLVRACVFGKEDYAACVFIQPVHHIDFVPGAGCGRQLGEDVRRVFFSFWDGGQAWRFIDRDDIVVFKQDRQHCGYPCLAPQFTAGFVAPFDRTSASSVEPLRAGVPATAKLTLLYFSA